MAVRLSLNMTFIDDVGLPIPSHISNEGLPGGSALLKDHHANPLKAYFKWRLGVRPLESEIKGISAIERQCSSCSTGINMVGFGWLAAVS